MNDVIDVVNASYTLGDNPCMGDLELLGLAEKVTEIKGKMAISYWRYLGNEPIRCDGKIMKKNSTTEPIEWDPT